MNVLVAGATGLVGSALLRVLSDGGHIVDRLVRSSPGDEGGGGRWDPEAGILDPGALGGHEAVVHLAGGNIAGAPWTPEGEEAAGEAARKGVRVVILRIGMVLSADGGALGKMLPVFRAGVGGRIGSGKECAGWIAPSALVGVIV